MADFSNLLTPGDQLNGFTVVSAEPLPEVEGWAYVLDHPATGAQLLWLANADDNRAYAISFKTPPADDTGVFHILEHSVLDGSDKYPVKEPFVNLLKTSMQTFLNALTFPDKTMYPVASTNVQDLENLMDVYLDAVLHPALYHRERIFEQEGWHYELESAEAPLTTNGVVLNEMKGALSDPEDVLFMHVKRRLFPDTAYAFESGGNPSAIPTLTYEGYCDTHARHYNLANSKSVLYGDLDIRRETAFLNERFSNETDRNAGAPNVLDLQAPVRPEPATVQLATAPENACVGIGYVFGTWADREQVLAADILLDALMGSNEAPLKRALLDAGLGDDVSAYLMDGLAQPFVLFEVRGAQPGVGERFQQVIEATCAELVADGLPVDRLEASLAQAEFNLRENDMGYPDGVAYAMTAMNGWLYSDDAPTLYLKYEDDFRDLSDSMGLGVFERLLDKMVVHNDHHALVTLEPVEGTGTAQEAADLAKVKEALTDEQLTAIMAEQAALKAEQAAPDRPEDVARLPHLTVADIDEGPSEPTSRTVDAPYPCTVYDIDTRRIDYCYLYFDLKRVAWAELPYVSVLVALLGKLDTHRHTAAELDTLIEANLGSFSTFIETYNDADDPLNTVKPKLVVAAASLSEKVDMLATLPAEVCRETLFGDTDRIKAILTQQRVALEQSFVNAGHTLAMSRCCAGFSKTALLSQQTSGIDYYRFLVKLLDRWDRRATGTCELLRNLCGRIFKGDDVEMSFAGAPGDVERYWQVAGDLGLERDGHATKDQLEVPTPRPGKEAFTVPSQVCYVAEGAAGQLLAHPTVYDGSWLVAAKALGYGYLWNEVRVLGGAYGAGFSCSSAPLLTYYSYRDPAVDPTLERYARAGQWLEDWTPTDEDLEGYIVSTVAALDAPVKPRALMRRQDTLRLAGRPAGWRQTIRAQVLAATVDSVRALAPSLADVPDAGAVCVVGGADIVAASNAGLTVQELL